MILIIFRCLADGQSAAFIINTMNREERMIKEEEEDSIIADMARSDPVRDVGLSSKRSSQSITSPKKQQVHRNLPRRKITLLQTDQLNRYSKYNKHLKKAREYSG